MEGENNASQVDVVVVGIPDPESGNRARAVIHRFQRVLHHPEIQRAPWPPASSMGEFSPETGQLHGCSRSSTDWRPWKSITGGQSCWQRRRQLASSSGRVKGENKSLMRFSSSARDLGLGLVPGGHRDDGLARGDLLSGGAGSRPDGPSLGRGASCSSHRRRHRRHHRAGPSQEKTGTRCRTKPSKHRAAIERLARGPAIDSLVGWGASPTLRKTARRCARHD